MLADAKAGCSIRRLNGNLSGHGIYSARHGENASITNESWIALAECGWLLATIYEDPARIT
jgi:hypothetical protein